MIIQNIKTFQYRDILDNLLEGSVIEWYKPYDKNYKLMADVGNINSDYNIDLYTHRLKHLVFTPVPVIFAEQFGADLTHSYQFEMRNDSITDPDYLAR